MGRVRRLGERIAKFFRKSVKRAFTLYALAAAIAALLLSVIVVGALTGIADEIWSKESGATGVYIYDEERDSLVPAERLSLRGSDVALYYEHTYVNPDYFPSISLQDPPRDVDRMHIVDDSADILVFGPNVASLGGDDSSQFDLGGIAEYDRQTNEERGGNADELADEVFGALQEDAPVTSLVGYYVYFEPSTWYVVVNMASIALIPVIVLACMFVAARLFYRRHLQGPIVAMGDAAQRISQGDLDFNVESREDGNELDRLCASFETMRGELDANERRMWRTAEGKRRANAAFAHDVRTPVTVIKGQAEILGLLAEGGALDGASVLDAAQTIDRQATRLERYAYSLRDLDAIELIEPHAEPVHLRIWFDHMSSDVSKLARGRDITFEAQYERGSIVLSDAMQGGSEAEDEVEGGAGTGVEGQFGAPVYSIENADGADGGEDVGSDGQPSDLARSAQGVGTPQYETSLSSGRAVLGYAMMDVSLVGRVVDNLVSNAVRYAQTTVSLTCVWASDVLVVRVCDDGPGFSREALSHASEAYWRSCDVGCDGDDAFVDDGHAGDAPCVEQARCGGVGDASGCGAHDGDAYGDDERAGDAHGSHSTHDGCAHHSGGSIAEVHFGLGLNIASVLCEKHGGTLALSNAADGGAVVEASFSAPAAAREEPA